IFLHSRVTRNMRRQEKNTRKKEKKRTNHIKKTKGNGLTIAVIMMKGIEKDAVGRSSMLSAMVSHLGHLPMVTVLNIMFTSAIIIHFMIHTERVTYTAPIMVGGFQEIFHRSWLGLI